VISFRQAHLSSLQVVRVRLKRAQPRPTVVQFCGASLRRDCAWVRAEVLLLKALALKLDGNGEGEGDGELPPMAWFEEDLVIDPEVELPLEPVFDVESVFESILSDRSDPETLPATGEAPEELVKAVPLLESVPLADVTFGAVPMADRVVGAVPLPEGSDVEELETLEELSDWTATPPAAGAF